MRVLLCSAAVAVALAVGGCGSDSGSSSTSRDKTTGAGQASPRALHYITREARPRSPGPHPGARVDHLIIRDVRKGVGPAIQAGDSGVFEFIVTDWVTGRTLETSWHTKRPYETKIERGVVIDGWWQGIPGMRVSGRRQIIVPPGLGFTNNPALADHITFFDVVLVQINRQRPPALQSSEGGSGSVSLG